MVNVLAPQVRKGEIGGHLHTFAEHKATLYRVRRSGAVLLSKPIYPMYHRHVSQAGSPANSPPANSP